MGSQFRDRDVKPRFICEFAMFPAIVAFTVTNTNGKACGVGFLEATLCWQRRGRSECLSQGEVPGRTEWSGLRAGTTSFHPEWALPAGEKPDQGRPVLPRPLACLGLRAWQSSAFKMLMGRPDKYFKVTQGLPWVLFIYSISATSV